jgi:hypothetical protein
MNCKWNLTLACGNLQCGKDAVVIEADRIKMSDPVFQALSRIEKGDSTVSAFVHNFSTAEANKLLVAYSRTSTPRYKYLYAM